MNITEQLDYIAKSLVNKFGNKIIFHGGYLLMKMFPNSAIQTYDIDCTTDDVSLYGGMRDVLYEVCVHLMLEDSIDGFTVKDVISSDRPGGADMYLGNKQVLGVDIGYRHYTFDTRMFGSDIGEIAVFDSNTLMADKLLDILPGKRLSHSKDLYDVYLMATNMDFNVRKIRQLMLARDRSVCNGASNGFPFSEADEYKYQVCYDELGVDVPFTKAYAKLNRIVDSILELEY